MDKFIYAAGYYPLMQKKEDWERDLKLMKKTGITVIRTAELFNTWDRIEPAKGQFEFDFLDEFFNLCEKYDMKILLGTGTCSPPYWLHEMYEEVNIVNNHGEEYPNNVSYSWACVDHSGYLEEVKRYVTVLVNRYKDHKALYAYQIHNEISLPFMPLQAGGVDLYCYNKCSLDHFKEWVESKYKTIENLNYAYRWGATNTCHTSFDQVIPPKTKPTSWSSVTRWLDWRLFWMENLVNFIKMQNELIKTMDTKHLTSTNIFFLKSQDPLGVLTALDQFEMAKVVDMIGFDLYPGSGNKLEKMPEFSSMFLDMSRSTAECLGKDYWLMETESGPINGWVLGPSRNVKGFDLIRNVYEAIGHDAKMTLYQGWREWDFQPLHWGAIVDLDGQETERTIAATKIGAGVSKDGELIKKAKTPKAKVAILMSKENAIVLNGMGQEDFLMKALRGAYRVFWEMNYKVDFITPEQVENGYVNNYKLVYMPFMAFVDENLAGGLATYVKDGGILVGGARNGMLGRYGWYNHTIPAFDLQSVFGLDAFEVEAKVNPNVSYKGDNYSGYWHKEIVKLQNEDVKVLARFNDDLPAVTINEYFAGKAIYIATHADVGYIEEDSKLLRSLMKDVLTENDIKPYVEIDYTNRKVKEIDVHALEADECTLLFVTNYATMNHSGFFSGGQKPLRIRINNDVEYVNGEVSTSGELLELVRGVGHIDLSVSVKKNETMIIKLNKK